MVAESTLHKQSVKLMGNRFEITIVVDDPQKGDALIQKAIDEIKRIEKLLTTFSEESETNLINANAGIAPVKVSKEIIQLIARSIKISLLTQGAFDISYGSIDKKLWNFDTNLKSLPDAETAKKSVRLINYRNIIIDEEKCTVFLAKQGMRIGFGGIGKGYAAEKAKQMLISEGVENGIVNASGDLTTWGHQPDGKPWTVGIAHPDMADTPFSYLNITNKAIATSGNYEKYAIINGKKYSHTIDPRTGLPVTGIKSVTIICNNAEMADALATPVTIMGIEAGLFLINQLIGIGCVIIDDNNRVFTSKNIHLS
ncbi:MAG: FAD:protein FMN transferase [Sphingobacteriia bacterium]